MKASAVLNSPLASDASAGPLPSFFVIGARKCGTTTLDQYMRQHPQICLPRGKKELNFFGDQAHRGLAWYRAHFAHAGADQLCGEVAPMYSIEQDPPCARRIAELVLARLIYIVRHPVERRTQTFANRSKPPVRSGETTPGSNRSTTFSTQTRGPFGPASTSALSRSTKLTSPPRPC